MEEDSTSTPAGSENVAATATTVSHTATLTSASSSRANQNNGHLTTAVAVDDRTIVVADPVEGSEAQETSKQEKRKQSRFCAVVGIVILVVISIVLSVGLTRRGTTIDTNPAGSGSESAGSPNEGGTDKPGFKEEYYERWNDTVAILAPLYEDFKGGVEVFNLTSLFASEDRINALNWLVVQDKVLIPTSPGNTSAIDSSDQEKYEQLASKVRQRYVLALLYMATNGQFWRLQYNFLMPFDECQWDSVYDPKIEALRDEFSRKGVICNDQGQVEKLSMCK